MIADFRNQVAAIEGLDLEVVATNFLEPGPLVDAIGRASGSVVILLRGGGNEGDFEVFNRPAVLEAWRCKNAFKITALGHTQNTTLLDRLSHKIADTPTAAGKYLLDQVNSQLAQAYWRDRAEKASELQAQQAQAVLRAQVEGVKAAESLQTQITVLLTTQKTLEVERATLQERTS